MENTKYHAFKTHLFKNVDSYGRELVIEIGNTIVSTATGDHTSASNLIFSVRGASNIKYQCSYIEMDIINADSVYRNFLTLLKEYKDNLNDLYSSELHISFENVKQKINKTGYFKFKYAESSLETKDPIIEFKIVDNLNRGIIDTYIDINIVKIIINLISYFKDNYINISLQSNLLSNTIFNKSKFENEINRIDSSISNVNNNIIKILDFIKSKEYVDISKIEPSSDVISKITLVPDEDVLNQEEIKEDFKIEHKKGPEKLTQKLIDNYFLTNYLNKDINNLCCKKTCFNQSSIKTDEIGFDVFGDLFSKCLIEKDLEGELKKDENYYKIQYFILTKLRNFDKDTLVAIQDSPEKYKEVVKDFMKKDYIGFNKQIDLFNYELNPNFKKMYLNLLVLHSILYLYIKQHSSFALSKDRLDDFSLKIVPLFYLLKLFIFSLSSVNYSSTHDLIKGSEITNEIKIIFNDFKESGIIDTINDIYVKDVPGSEVNIGTDSIIKIIDNIAKIIVLELNNNNSFIYRTNLNNFEISGLNDAEAIKSVSDIKEKMINNFGSLKKHAKMINDNETITFFLKYIKLDKESEEDAYEIEKCKNVEELQQLFKDTLQFTDHIEYGYKVLKTYKFKIKDINDLTTKVEKVKHMNNIEDIRINNRI